MTIVQINAFRPIAREELDVSPFFTRIEQQAEDKEYTPEEAATLTGEMEALRTRVAEESLVESGQEHLLAQVASSWQRAAPFIKMIGKQNGVVATMMRLVVQENQLLQVTKNKFIGAVEQIKKIITSTLHEIHNRAERTFRFKNFNSAAPLYTCLHRFLPENEMITEKLGDIAMAQGCFEDALSYYEQARRESICIKKALCFFSLSKKEKLQQELTSIGILHNKSIKSTKDMLVVELLLEEEKYDEMFEMSKAFFEHSEWRLLVRLRAHLEISDDKGDYFFEQYPSLFKEFRALGRHSSFRCRTEDILVNIFSFVELAVDQCYCPFLKKLLFERLIKKNNDFFSSDEHQEVILDRMQRGFEELQVALKKGESLLATYIRVQQLLPEQRREEKIVLRQCAELLYGGAHTMFPAGVIARLRLYDEIMGDLLENTASTSMKRKYDTFDTTFSNCVYAFARIQEKIGVPLQQQFSSKIERTVDSFEWLRDTLSDIKI